MENRTGRTIGLILANASSSFTTAFMDLFQQELYQKDYKLVIGLTNHDLEKERFYLEFFGRTTEGITFFPIPANTGNLQMPLHQIYLLSLSTAHLRTANIPRS